jgi:hypothetical protein
MALFVAFALGPWILLAHQGAVAALSVAATSILAWSWMGPPALPGLLGGLMATTLLGSGLLASIVAIVRLVLG